MGNCCAIYQDVNGVLQRYGVAYTFNRGEEILNRAFTHTPIAGTKGSPYLRLSHLGDSILGAIVTNYAYRKFPEANNSVLHFFRENVVNNDNLSGLSKSVGLLDLIKYDNLDIDNATDVHADVFESFIGAVFEIAGFDVCSRLVVSIIEREMDILEVYKQAWARYREASTKRIYPIITHD